MTPLPVERASQLASPTAASERWLVQELWSDQAVGILGGEPKCCKSFLALDLAVSVAAGVPCLRQFPVLRAGPVLLFPAEDALPVVKERLAGICALAQVPFEPLPVHVITSSGLRLDTETDRQRLAQSVKSLQPRLLILDPLIRLHRLDENDAGQIARLLSFLRQLQRQFELAVLLVHHARKDARGTRPGQALRGSSELHGWGDSNLYLRRRGERLTLSTEHRAAVSREAIALELTQRDSGLGLALVQPADSPASEQAATPHQRILESLAQLDQPACLQTLRQHARMRTATLCECLQQLQQQGRVIHDARGYRLTHPDARSPVSLSLPIAPPGNGNGKPPPPELSDPPLCSSGG